jgi:hypothetical protein
MNCGKSMQMNLTMEAARKIVPWVLFSFWTKLFPQKNLHFSLTKMEYKKSHIHYVKSRGYYVHKEPKIKTANQILV